MRLPWVITSLQHAKPMVCLPTQEEQRERAYRLEVLGVAEFPCRNKWDGIEFARSIRKVTTEPYYRNAATQLKAQVAALDGPSAVAQHVTIRQWQLCSARDDVRAPI